MTLGRGGSRFSNLKRSQAFPNVARRTTIGKGLARFSFQTQGNLDRVGGSGIDVSRGRHLERFLARQVSLDQERVLEVAACGAFLGPVSEGQDMDRLGRLVHGT